MAQTRCGISAKQIQREMGIISETAWCMCSLICRMLEEYHDLFSAKVELEETYIGGKAHGKRGRV
jgi:transposase